MNLSITVLYTHKLSTAIPTIDKHLISHNKLDRTIQISLMHHSAETWLGDKKCSGYSLASTCIKTCGLKLNTDMIPARPLTMPSLNICKIEATSHNPSKCIYFFVLVFQLMSNVTEKWYTFHVYTLFIIVKAWFVALQFNAHI